MKKLVALILAAALCIGMFSTLAYAEEAKEGYKVGVILYDTECQWAKDIMGVSVPSANLLVLPLRLLSAEQIRK